MIRRNNHRNPTQGPFKSLQIPPLTHYIHYYTPLPLNIANKQQQARREASKHVTIPFWPMPLPIASGFSVL